MSQQRITKTYHWITSKFPVNGHGKHDNWRRFWLVSNVCLSFPEDEQRIDLNPQLLSCEGCDSFPSPPASCSSLKRPLGNVLCYSLLSILALQTVSTLHHCPIRPTCLVFRIGRAHASFLPISPSSPHGVPHHLQCR